MTVHAKTGLPFAEGLDSVADLPHTFTYVITMRVKMDSLNELPKDKRPSRGLLDKPFAMEDFLDSVWGPKKQTSDSEFIEFDLEEAE